jgi:hypothetical protein
VSGLSRSPASPRPSSSGPATLVSDALSTCDTTMPVQLDPELGVEQPPASGPRRVTAAPPARSRLGLISLGASVLIAAGLVAWRQQRPAEARSGAPLAITLPSRSPLRPTPAPLAAPSQPAPVAAPSALPPSPPEESSVRERAKVASGPKPPHAKPAAPSAQSATAALTTQPPVLPDSSAAAPISAPPDPGLSEIERLIEQRH